VEVWCVPSATDLLCVCRYQNNVIGISVLRYFLETYLYIRGTAVAQWLRCCATNRKVAGSIPATVSGFFIDIKSCL